MAQNKTELESVSQFISEDKAITMAIIFGSVAKGTQTAKSDLDIAIKTQKLLTTPQKMALVESLALLLGRPVDLVDLQTVGEPLLGQILQYGKLLKGSHTDLARLALKNIYANEDFMPYIQRTLKERRDRWIK